MAPLYMGPRAVVILEGHSMLGPGKLQRYDLFSASYTISQSIYGPPTFQIEGIYLGPFNWSPDEPMRMRDEAELEAARLAIEQ